jgi:hypothetical protein
MRFALIVFALLLFGVSVEAHESGTSYELIVEGYTVDIGYSIEAPTTDDVVAFDFQLQKDTADAPFSDAWVKIEDARGAVVFASGIHNAQFGGARMSYRFPEAGTYTMTVRYEAGDVRLAEAIVPLSVAEIPEETPTPPWLLVGLGGALLLAVVSVVAWRSHAKVSP